MQSGEWCEKWAMAVRHDGSAPLDSKEVTMVELFPYAKRSVQGWLQAGGQAWQMPRGRGREEVARRKVLE